MDIVKKRSLATASAAGNVNNVSGENGAKLKSMYYYFLYCSTWTTGMSTNTHSRALKRQLYGMAVSMSADLLRSMPKHLSEESEPAQSTKIQGKN